MTRPDPRDPMTGLLVQGHHVAVRQPQACDPLPLSVREATYDGNYDIEAWLDGQDAGLAFRVKDKLNYSFVTQSFAVRGLYWVYVWQIRDGQLMMPSTWGFVPMVESSTEKHVHIKALDDDLGVWLEDNGTWKCVIDPATNGAAVLDWPDAGSVGLVAGWLAWVAPPLCYQSARSAQSANAAVVQRQ